MRGRIVLGVALALLAAVSSATAGDPGGDRRAKERIDARIARLQDEIDKARNQEGVLTSQLSDVTATLRLAQQRVDAQQARVDELDASLARAESALQQATAVLQQKTAFLHFAERLDRKAETRLERRLRQIYMHGRPSTLSVLLSATSFADAVDDVEVIARLARQDRRIGREAREAHVAARHARSDAARARAAARSRADVLAARTAAATAARDQLAARRDAVAAVRRVKAQALAGARADKRDFLVEVAGLQAQSAALGARIRAEQSSPSSFTPPTGTPGRLQWPVSGPITSGFGMRWGRMHEGIDIAVPSGTPVHAAAAGRVVYAGWMEGYGNIVVLDHGGGLSTAYAHNTSLAVSVGQDVAAGQVISYSGSTGHSTGPHVHFEVRVGGVAADPLAYL